jgi:hypothetical protein
LPLRLRPLTILLGNDRVEPALADLGEPLGRAGLGTMAPRSGVEHASTADRSRWRDITQHESIAGTRDERRLQAKLCQPDAERDRSCRNGPRPVVDLKAAAIDIVVASELDVESV